MEFCSLQRISGRGARLTRVCLTRHVPLSRFLTFSAACFSPTLSEFISPQFRSWDSPFRAFPSGRAGTPLGALSPLAVIALRPPGWAPSFLCPGKETMDDSASGFCSLPESVLIDLGVSQIERRCPPGFFLSRGRLTRRRALPFGCAPLVGLPVHFTGLLHPGCYNGSPSEY